MSFPALRLAVIAARSLPPLEDDEFGLSWEDLELGPPLYITWAAYRSEGAGVVLGVWRVDTPTVGSWLDEALDE